MRPLRLEVKGFTSFRDEQRVDFTDLDLFAVVGPTGSGKSSLLDAITYALYGEVDRVGTRVSQLVSQGQPTMAVSFEFEVSGARYRVTRRTPATGATKILLQVQEGDEWQQAGDGADRVRDVNARLRDAIGLDYDAFTRSVLLPQGRFAEFLVGEAKARREILTELLGLELFKRLQKRAGEIRGEAAASAQAKSDLLEREYGGATAEAVAAARVTAKEAAARAKALAAASKTVDALAKKGERGEREVHELRDCAGEARSLAERTGRAAESLEELAGEVARARNDWTAATKGAASLEKEAADAVQKRERVESAWGRATDLVALRGRAEDLQRRRSELSDAEKELGRERAGLPKLERKASAAAKALERAETARAKGAEVLAAARAKADQAQHADLVAAVRAGVAAGDPCPICGTEISTLPRTPAAVDLDAALKAAAGAERKHSSLDRSVRDAEREHHAAVGLAEQAEKQLHRVEQEIDRRNDELDGLEAELRRAVGDEVEDPLAAIGERLDEVQRLADVERTASQAFATAESLRAEAERTVTSLEARVGEQRATLAALPIAALQARAKRLAGAEATATGLPAASRLPKDEGALAAAAVRAHDAIESLVDRLEQVADDRAAAVAELLSQAESAIGGLVEWRGRSLEDLCDVARDAAREAAADSGTEIERVARVTERLAAARALTEDARDLRARADRFAALAKELRADNVIEFLQLEALQLLAEGGSQRLSTLSDGRYRLAFMGDEFFVIDTWNGEEMRSARTLSGGETFLASLALALALSEQVQSLAVAEKARLESLFLDEGFGALDPETLETVVAAIEQLGGEDRMVGVITHVQELAIRLPARIEVEKSPRGSRLSVTA